VNSITILDGGMGKELARTGAPFRQPEWSALALMEDPSAVSTVHRNFIEAGARVITTNAYAVVPFHIGADRFAERGHELAGLAGRLAREAADGAASDGHEVRVAGCLPPAFGSYAPENFNADAAPAIYDVLVAAQAKWVDVWLGETVGSCAELDAIAAALDRHGTDRPRWFSFSLADSGPLADTEHPRLWSGESLTDGAKRAVAAGAEAVLINCSQPEMVSAAVPELTDALAAASQSRPGLAWGAYANIFEQRPEGYGANELVLGHREDMTVAAYAEVALRWRDAGASIVGGCCGIHPEHIAGVADALG
jgi:S-methylmethionine-dependent homocysteine/selenocysteine methylase